MDWLIVIPIRSIATIFDNCFPRSHPASFPSDNEQSVQSNVCRGMKELCECLYSIDVVIRSLHDTIIHTGSLGRLLHVWEAQMVQSEPESIPNPIFTLNYPASFSEFF